jgi:replicative DNA helicase
MQQQQQFFKKQQVVSDGQRESLLGKMLPMNLEAEKSILGAILLNDSCFNMVEETLQPQDFYVLAHQTIFKHMATLARSNKRIDMITIQDILQKENELVAIGDVAYLIELQENIPALGMLEQHAQIIRAKAVLRNLISSSVDIISSCYNQNEAELD